MAGGIINTGSFPKALWPGLKGLWGREYAEHPMEWTDLFNTVSSDKAYEEYMSSTGFGLASMKPQGRGVSYDSEQQGYIARLTNATYALGYVVTMEELQDNQYERIAKARTRMLAFSARQTKENVAALVYNRAFTSGYVGADAVVLCSTAHTNITGGTYANTPTVGAPLSEASLEDALIAIMGMSNDRGLLVSIMPRSLHVPRQEWFNANRIMQSVYQSGNANNDINVLKATNALPGGIKMNHYLTSATAWFLRTTVGGGGNGLMYQERMGIQFDQDNDFDTKNFKAAFIERYCFGWDDPRSLWGNPGV